MRKAALLIIVLLIGIGTANCDYIGLGTGESKVDFIYDWDEAQERAQAENKPIMINFYTDTCPACDRLDSNTYSDDELSAFLNTNFICLKSNMTKDTLYKNYSNVEYVPTIIFTSLDGTEIYRMVGYRNADSFYQRAQEVLSQWEP